MLAFSPPFLCYGTLSFLISHSLQFFRHPDFFTSGVLLWAHHEKIIIIDQTLAFVGGIDLAFGRWDNECHEISDSGPVPQEHITQIQTPTELVSKRETNLLQKACENLLTLGAHAQRGLLYLVCVSLCVSVCLHLFPCYGQQSGW